MHILIAIISRRFILIIVAAFIIMLMVIRKATSTQQQKNNNILAYFAIPLIWAVILLVIFGPKLSSRLIYDYGEPGTAIVTRQESTNNTYNDEVVQRYYTLLETAEGEKIETHFESWDFNIYPRPEGGAYVYPAQGEEFSVRYLAKNPNLFVILAQEESDYSEALNCQQLLADMNEAKQKMEFIEDDVEYENQYQVAVEIYEKAECL